jgi:hypothetical protein
MRAPLVVSTLLVTAFACTSRDVEEHPAFTEKPERPPRQSDIVKVETPVPPGVQLACESLLDAGEVGHMFGEAVTIRDRSSTKPDTTAVCGIHRTGTPPSREAQRRRSEETGILGVLPGDELCTIEARCSTPSSVQGLVSRCEERGDELNEDLGVPACVHTSQRGPRWAYTYQVYDAKTQCIFRVLGGPSVTDEALVQKCTDIALTTISPDRVVAP